MNYSYSRLFRGFLIILSAFRICSFNYCLGSLVLVSLALSGCKKEEECDGSCIEVSGRVGSEQNSAVPLKDADIQLSSIGNGSSFFPAKEIYIKQTRSNSDGFYSIKFVPTGEMQSRGSYRLLYSKKGYGDESLGSSVTRAYEANLRLVPGGRYEENLHLPLLGGRLRLLITGFPGGSATNSTYTIVYSGRARRGYQGIGMQSTFYSTSTGQDADPSNITDATCKTAANEYAFVQIYKTKVGVHTSVQDSIYCPVNQTVTYTYAF